MKDWGFDAVAVLRLHVVDCQSESRGEEIVTCISSGTCAALSLNILNGEGQIVRE